jgi:Zn-dependent membrane protease YugP
LSRDIYNGTSLASVAVAAHETGHALQHASGYVPLQLRSTFVPVANFGSNLGPILILVGFFMPAYNILLKLGIIAFSFTVLFQLITLPVEYNASGRALVLLQDGGMLEQDEAQGVKAMLNAAALTYLAAALAAILQLVRFIIIAQGRNDD